MAKYARIRNNDKTSVFKINGCDSCPFMKFSLKDSIAKCKMYSDEKESDVVDIFVVNHCDDGIIYDRIDTPKWCGLPNNESEVFISNVVYRPFLNSVMMSIMNKEEMDFDVNPPIIDIEYYKNSGDKRITDYLSQFVDRESDRWSKLYKEMGRAARNDTPTPTPKVQVCSNCGEDDENVKRDLNYGMCDECWKLHKNNKKILNKTFINNFRLKRNKSVIDKPIKLINLI